MIKIGMIGLGKMGMNLALEEDTLTGKVVAAFHNEFGGQAVAKKMKE